MQLAMALEPPTIVPQPRAQACKEVAFEPKQVATCAEPSQVHPVVVTVLLKQVRIPIVLYDAVFCSLTIGMVTTMTMSAKTDVTRIYTLSQNEILSFDTWSCNHQIFTLPIREGYRIINHLYPPEVLALMDAFVNGTTEK